MAQNQQNAAKQEFIEITKLFFVDAVYEKALCKLSLTSIDAVFSFNAGKNLSKDNLAPFRSRLQFEIDKTPNTVYLKRYDRPPITAQVKNWLSHRKRKSYSGFEVEAARELAAEGIKTPKIICYGEQWGLLFEKRSFIATEKIPNAEALERKLPPYFEGPATRDNLRLRRDFIARLASFVNKFHRTQYRHRDLYFSHIYCGSNGSFYLIDLARAFKPMLFRERFRVKDIAQLHYSAPGKHFSRTDRLRFYLQYFSQKKLTANNKAFIRKIMKKTKSMAQHNIKHGRAVPFTK
jgi:tRNA A-37 threonylcarbamoyl transferase component Bud32